MRKKLISRLIEIAAFNSFFPKSIMRWQNKTFAGKFLRDIVFDEMNLEMFTDDELLDLYSQIVIQSSKQF